MIFHEYFDIVDHPMYATDTYTSAILYLRGLRLNALPTQFGAEGGFFVYTSNVDAHCHDYFEPYEEGEPWPTMGNKEKREEWRHDMEQTKRIKENHMKWMEKEIKQISLLDEGADQDYLIPEQRSCQNLYMPSVLPWCLLIKQSWWHQVWFSWWSQFHSPLCLLTTVTHKLLDIYFSHSWTCLKILCWKVS